MGFVRYCVFPPESRAEHVACGNPNTMEAKAGKLDIPEWAELVNLRPT